MSRSTNNSELPKTSGSEYNTNEIKTKISALQFEAKGLYFALEKKQPYFELIAIHNRLAQIHAHLQLKHARLRDFYNQNK